MELLVRIILSIVLCYSLVMTRLVKKAKNMACGEYFSLCDYRCIVTLKGVDF